MKKCNVVAIIPARWGSSRLEGKPMRLIAGKPMIQWVYERTAQCSQLSRVIVATDNQRIIDCVHQIGGEAVLSEGEFETGSDRIAGVAEQLGLSDDTIILNVQGDQPLIHPQSLSALVDKFIDNKDKANEMATLGYALPFKEAQSSSIVKMVIDYQQYALYFSRSIIPYGRDEQPKYLLSHLGVYIYSFGFLKRFRQLESGYLENLEKLEQLRVLENGYKIQVMMSEYNSPEVDVDEDIENIEQLIE